MLNPHKVCQLCPIANEVDVVELLNNPNIIKNLKNEIPRYVSNADGIWEGVDPIHCWKPNEAELPHWSSAAKMVLLRQPLLTESESVLYPNNVIWTCPGYFHARLW